MSDLESGKARKSAGYAKGMMGGAVRESKFTRTWFLTLTILSFGFALVIPIGCMSPPTQYFTLFSISPRILAHQYNTMIMNTTEQKHYDPERLEADLIVLPDVYRVGMSGVCREFHNSSEVHCTKHFPQLLDFGALIDADIDKSGLQNVNASQLRTFWDSFTKNDNNNFVRNKNQYISFVRASAGLTITSLVITPIGLGIVILMYILELPHYTTVATCIALFDAALMVTAATLWVTASMKYSFDIMLALGSTAMQNTSIWGKTDVIPMSIGLFLFAGVAIVKLIVLPIMALMCLILFFILIIAVVIMAWLMFLMLMCMLAMFGACGDGTTTTTTETVYYNNYTPYWAAADS